MKLLRLPRTRRPNPRLKLLLKLNPKLLRKLKPKKPLPSRRKLLRLSPLLPLPPRPTKKNTTRSVKINPAVVAVVVADVEDKDMKHVMVNIEKVVTVDAVTTKDADAVDTTTTVAPRLTMMASWSHPTSPLTDNAEVENAAEDVEVTTVKAKKAVKAVTSEEVETEAAVEAAAKAKPDLRPPPLLSEELTGTTNKLASETMDWLPE